MSGFTFADAWDDISDEVEAAPVATGVPDPLPPGDYVMHLDEFEFRQTKDGNGMMFACKFAVAEGEYEGRTVWQNMNIRNPNATAQKIGIGEVKALCAAVGLDLATVKDEPANLLLVPFLAKVGMEKPQEGYDPRNRIKAFKPLNAAPAAAAPASRPAPAQRAAAPVTAAAKTGSGGLPWKQKASA